MMDKKIEVAVTEEIDDTQRGALLEKLGKEVLEIMQYQVTDQVQLTGMEVDLLATHQIKGEEIYVECKAKRANLPADVIAKLVGQVEIRDVSAGWIITTSDFTKGGKGLIEEWRKKPAEKRNKLVVYRPENLIDLLINSRRIFDPDNIAKSDQIEFSKEALLLITNHGNYWALSTIDPVERIPSRVVLFDGETGKPVDDRGLVECVSKTDSTLSNLVWIAANEIFETNVVLEGRSDSQPIVKVSPGDSWEDYRPSRPQDFIGREAILNEVISYFDDVRKNNTGTRLMAIRSTSGMGKSSIVLKLVSRCHNKMNRNKYYVYAVDCRAATSNRYGELAMKTCLEEAIDDGFLPRGSDVLTFGTPSNPLGDPSIKETLRHLKDEEKVIVLFFDQFEEIFGKQELFGLFKELTTLCNVVNSSQENIIIGFAWKTDGSIPPDHPAYYMWQKTSDHRREFSLPQFNKAEISKAITKFASVINESVNPQLRRILIDHCQGYPWLLKKLCIHVYTLIRSGKEQSEILSRSMDIGELFERDLSELSGEEMSCIKQIASESPADFFKIENIYSDQVINSLVGTKRLVVRSGPKLILYWDIFRDYVLTGKVPQIPHSYLPQTQITRYLKILQLLLFKGEIHVNEIVLSLGLGYGTVDNTLRDLIMIGNADVNRKTGIVKCLQESEKDAAKRLFDFWNNHELLQNLLNITGSDFSVTREDINYSLRDVLKGSEFSERTWNTYINRVISWLKALEIIESIDGEYEITTTTYIEKLPVIKIGRKKVLFLGEAPPERVIENIYKLAKNRINVKIPGQARNSLAVLKSLNIEYSGDEIKLMGNLDVGELEKYLAEKVKSSAVCKLANEIIRQYVDPTGDAIGDSIADHYGFGWSKASRRRYGNAIKRWAKWVEEVLDNKEKQLTLS